MRARVFVDECGSCSRSWSPCSDKFSADMDPCREAQESTSCSSYWGFEPFHMLDREVNT